MDEIFKNIFLQSKDKVLAINQVFKIFNEEKIGDWFIKVKFRKIINYYFTKASKNKYQKLRNFTLSKKAIVNLFIKKVNT